MCPDRNTLVKKKIIFRGVNLLLVSTVYGFVYSKHLADHYDNMQFLQIFRLASALPACHKIMTAP